MALRLVYGRAGYGKTHYITDIILKRKSKGDKSVLFVPEQYTHIAEHKLLSQVGSISAAGVEVTSFNKMSRRLERDMGVTDVLSPMAKNIIMADVISCADLKYFENASEKSGFSDICLKLVGEFKKYCIMPDQLSESIEKTDNPRLKLKLEDIVSIYKEYLARALAAGYDSDDGASDLARYIQNELDLSGTVYFFDEFTSFIPQEIEVIKQIAAKAEDVYITLCTDGVDDVLFAPIAKTAERLKSMCRDANIEFAEPVVLTEDKKHGTEIAFLEKNLFPYPQKKYNDDTFNLSIFSAAAPYDEVEDAARKILKLTRDSGYRFKDIAVICSDIGAYAPFIKPVFKKHGIEYFIDEKTPAVNHPIITFVLNIIDIYLNDYNNEEVFSFLKSGFCDADLNSVYLLENYCRNTNMRKSTWLSDDKWNTLMARQGVEPLKADAISAVRESIVIPLAGFHNTIKGRHSASYMCEALYNYLIDIGLVRHIEERLKMFEKTRDVLHGEEYEKIWNIIIGALDAVAQVMGDKTINVKSFRTLLETAFSGYSIGFIPTALDGVFVGNITRSKSDDIKVLFVLGANDGVFPSPAPTGEIINDGDKALLADTGIELAADSKTQAFFERFFMYSAFTLPEEMLFVSFSRTGSNGDTLRPSFVLSDFKRVFTDLTVESDILEDISDFGQMDYITASVPTLEKMTEQITKYRAGEDISPVWLDVYDYFCRNFDFGTKLNRYWNQTNQAKAIDRALMKEFIGDRFYTTISRLERYRKCKFSYFLEYILELKANEEFDVTTLDTGTFVHSVIERLCRDMSSDGYDFKTVTDEYIYEKTDAFIEEFIKKLTENNAYVSNRKLYIIKRLRGAIFRCFVALKSHITESKFQPLGYEIRFNEENFGTIDFDLGDGKCAKITGVIDRGDVYKDENGEYVRVIDYKTGSKTFSFSNVFYGLDIQLIVYLNALVKSDDKYRYGGALYFRIDDPVFKAKYKSEEVKIDEKLITDVAMDGFILGEDAIIDATDSITVKASKKATYDNFVALEKHLGKIITELCNDMVGGNIEIRPYAKQKESPCKFCAYASVCRFDAGKKGNGYDVLSGFADDEIWDRLGGDDNVD